MKITESVCLALIKWFRGKNLLDQFYAQDFITEDVFFDYIYGDATRSFNVFNTICDLTGKKILDVGCGIGARTIYYAQQQVKKITGSDINPEFLSKARKILATKYPDIQNLIEFQPCEEQSMPFDDNVFDIVIMDCVFEHISHPLAVLRESCRVIKPGGYICIDFQPWWNPHGAHMDNMIPIPWNHVLFSEKTLINVAAKIYENGDYREAFWDYSADGKIKKPNKWLALDQLPELNKMTIRKFNKIINQSQIPVYHYSLISYENIHRQWVARTAGIFWRFIKDTPFREFFTRCVVCVLQKEK